MSTPNDTSAAPASPGTSIAPAPIEPPPRVCLNCGATLLGEHCHACGQPVKGMIRPLSSMLHDVADTILNVDARIFHTLVPLYVRPGFLSNEYFAGRRMRYVTPFRLYFFLSVIAFFAVQFALSDLNLNNLIVNDDLDKIAAAQSADEVGKVRDEAIARITAAKATPNLPDSVLQDWDKEIKLLRQKGDRRIERLQRIDEAKSKGVSPPSEPQEDKDDFKINDVPWNAKTNPVRIAWLPMFANNHLNTAIGRIKDNIPRIKKDPKPFLLGAFGMLAQVLFVLMPLFALMLKVFYLFKRRLYMEHLIVALHSHAFVFMSMLLLTMTGLLHSWATTAAPRLALLLNWVMVAMGWWLPIYLFLMQKKVYRQGWFFTTIKFGAIGICYTVMISLGIAAAFVISLATT
jgi:hypothetical protein